MPEGVRHLRFQRRRILQRIFFLCSIYLITWGYSLVRVNGTTPDLELVQEVQNGSRHAFTELMRRYQERVYWVARRIVGSHDDADDIVQEAFVKAYLSLGEFRGDSSFYTWIYRIAVNMSLNVLRRRKIWSYLHEGELLTRILPSSDDPGKDLEHSEIETALHRVTAKLPERQKAVFVMRYFDEMTYKEIALVLNKSEGGLKANYFHALRKVRKYMRHEIQDREKPSHG